jgi:hypothetical protein
MKFEIELDDDELELLEQMSYYPDIDQEYQSPEMEALGDKIREVIMDLE